MSILTMWKLRTSVYHKTSLKKKKNLKDKPQTGRYLQNLKLIKDYYLNYLRTSNKHKK